MSDTTRPEKSRELRLGDICAVSRSGYRPCVGKVVEVRLDVKRGHSMDGFTLESEGLRMLYYRKDLREASIIEIEKWMRRNKLFAPPKQLPLDLT